MPPRGAPVGARRPDTLVVASRLPLAGRHLLLGAILIFAAVLRLYHLDITPPGVYTDEAMDGNNARAAWETGDFRVFYPENNGREGLYINLCAPVIALIGSTPLTVRLPAAIFGVLTVWVVYLLGARLFSPRVGLLGAFLMAASTWHMHSSRLTNRANLAPFFLALAIYLGLLGMDRVRAGQPWLAMILFAGIAYGLGFHTYISYRATPLLMLAIWHEGWTRRFRPALIVFWASAALVVAPLALHFAKNPGDFSKRMSQVSALADPHPTQKLLKNAIDFAQMFFFKGDMDWRHNISGRPELFWPVAVLFAVGLIWAAVHFRRGAWLLGWLAISALAPVFSVDGAHLLRACLAFPPVFLLAAIGGNWIYERCLQRAPRALGIALVALFVLVVAAQPGPEYFGEWARHREVPEAFSAWLGNVAYEIERIGRATPKYIAMPKTTEEVVRGIPVYLESVPYLTESFTDRERRSTNMHYLLQAQADPDPDYCETVRKQHPNSPVFCLTFNPPASPRLQ